MVRFNFDTQDPGSLEVKDAVLIKGADGKSAYQVAVDNGFQGTQEEWLESLKGEGAFQLWKVDPSFEVTFDCNVEDKLVVDDYMVKISDTCLDLRRCVAVEGFVFFDDAIGPYRAEKNELELYDSMWDEVVVTCLSDPYIGDVACVFHDDVVYDGEVYVPAGTYIIWWGYEDYVSRVVFNSQVELVEPYVLPIDDATLEWAKRYAREYAEDAYLKAYSQAYNDATGYAKGKFNEAINAVSSSQNYIVQRVNSMQDDIDTAKVDARLALNRANDVSDTAHNLRIEMIQNREVGYSYVASAVLKFEHPGPDVVSDDGVWWELTSEKAPLLVTGKMYEIESETDGSHRATCVEEVNGNQLIRKISFLTSDSALPDYYYEGFYYKEFFENGEYVRNEALGGYVTVSELIEKISTIDPKFIPDTIATKDYVAQEIRDMGTPEDGVDVSSTVPSKATTYYPVYVDGTSGKRVVRCTPRLYLYDTGGAVYFNVGSTNQVGGLTVHHSNGKYVNLLSGTPTANRNINLPDIDGTLVTATQMTDAINAAISGAIGGSY